MKVHSDVPNWYIIFFRKFIKNNEIEAPMNETIKRKNVSLAIAITYKKLIT